MGNSVKKPASGQVLVEVLSSLRGKYKLPYTKGHVVNIEEKLATEIIKNNDAKLYVKPVKKAVAKVDEAAAAESEVKDPETVE